MDSLLLVVFQIIFVEFFLAAEEFALLQLVGTLSVDESSVRLNGAAPTFVKNQLQYGINIQNAYALPRNICRRSARSTAS